MGHSYTWRGGNGAGGNGSLSLAADWSDLSAGTSPAVTAPGTGDSASIAGPLAGVLTVGGTLSVAALATSGGVALTGAVTAGTLAVAGTLALTGGASLAAASANLTGGALAASGAATTVSVTGTLTLAGDASAQGGASIAAGAVRLTGGTLELDALSSIAIGVAPLQAGTLAVGTGALLSGTGRLSGPVADAGTIAASGGVLSIFGAITGTGTLAIGAGATLFAAGAVGAGITAAFTGAAGVLELFTTGSAFAGTITGFAPGDAIEIASANIAAAAWAAGILTLSATDGSSLGLALPSGSAAEAFVALPDGLGGSLVLLAPAALAAPSGVTVTLGGAGLVLLSGSGHANTLTVTGTVAVAGMLTTPQLTQTGTIAVLAGGTFSATTASIASGLLLGEGAGGTLTVAGRLGLGGTLAMFAGAAASVGTLALSGGTLSLDAYSSLSVGGAAGRTGLIVVTAGNTLAGHGTVAGALDVEGVVQAQGGVLTLVAPASGGGSLAIGPGATLAAFGPVALPVGFAAGATLELYGTLAGFTGALTGFATGDALDLGSASFDSVAWSAGTLSLLSGGSVAQTLAIAGNYAGQSWQAAADGGGGTLVTLAANGGGVPLTVTGTLNVATAITAPSAIAQPGAMVAMAGGTLSVASLTLAAGSSLTGHGTVAGVTGGAGIVTASGGVLAITGTLASNGVVTIAAGATLYVPSGIAAGPAVTFSGSGGTLELFGSAAGLLATVGGLAAGNAIDIAGAAVTGAAYAQVDANDGVLSLAGAAGSLGSIELVGPYAGYAAATLPDGRGGTLISLVPCFAAGTRIATPAGEVPVERLRVGDMVLTASGPCRLRWAARRLCDATIAPELRAVRVRAGALGDGLPRRDLLLSPQHALYLRGVLVPAVALVNGRGIRRDPATVIQYHHIGFDRHTTVFAEGASTESYLPVSADVAFDHEAGERPLPRPPCAPVITGGALLEGLRRHLFGPPPNVMPPGRLLGHVERIVRTEAGTVIEGWAVNADDPAQPVHLPIHRDGTLCGVALANQWRPDLDRAGLAGGRCGFSARISGPPHGVSLCRAGDAAPLPMIC